MRFLLGFALFVLSLPAMAGGFYTEVFRPNEAATAKVPDAYLIARLTGCHQPERGALQATAVGIVNGKRQTMPVKLLALDTPGLFVVERSWPREGKWVLHLHATHPEITQHTTTLVSAEGAAFAPSTRKSLRMAASKAEIDAEIVAMLR